MRKSDQLLIYKEIACMSNLELLSATANGIYLTADSISEKMVERGYDPNDVKEYQKYEKYLSEKLNIYIECCNARGIDLFQIPIPDRS